MLIILLACLLNYLLLLLEILLKFKVHSVTKIHGGTLKFNKFGVNLTDTCIKINAV